MGKNFKIGQTIIELAIFGAILMFIIGLIVQQGLGAAHQQNNALKAMRMALALSHQFSEGFGDAYENEMKEYFEGKDLSDKQRRRISSFGAASRNSAAILLVEDRLTADASKYGAIERIPLITGGSGIHSRNLFLPVDTGEYFNLPVYDVFVNGKHFPFSMAGFKKMCLTKDGSGCASDSEWIGERAQQRGLPDSSFWDFECLKRVDITTEVVTFVGCAKLFTSVPNHPAISDYCAEDCPEYNLPVNDRFDLDRDGAPDVPREDENWLRKNFGWQWMVVSAFDERVGGAERDNLKTQNGIQKGDESANNLSVDVDMDLQEEQIVEITGWEMERADRRTGIITEIIVEDFQEGDMNFSVSDFDLQDPTVKSPGLVNELEMYTKTKEGTYLRIEEGQLFTIDEEGRKHQLVRSIQRRDSVDLIARKIQLSNNTGRFCDGERVTPLVGGYPNPVEVCSDDCYKKENFEKTCYNIDPKVNVIVVRSNIFAGQGRKWIVDLFGDETVEFEVPKVK